MEIKMALIGILKKYKFVRAPETEVSEARGEFKREAPVCLPYSGFQSHTIQWDHRWLHYTGGCIRE